MLEDCCTSVLYYIINIKNFIEMLIIDTRCDPPCSVKAFLEGHTNLKNDMPFVIAALNADCVFWMLTKDGLKQRLY